MNMLNDDTTQILLAIVLGIVICWFIFGRNCGNNGFSVGGQACNTATTPADCCQNTYDTSCLILGPTFGDGAKCDNADKSSETYCFNESNYTIISDDEVNRRISSLPRGEAGGPVSFDVGCETLGGTTYRKNEAQNVLVCPEPAPAQPAAEPPAQPAAEPPAPPASTLQQKKEKIFEEMKHILLKFYSSTSNTFQVITRLRVSYEADNPYMSLQRYADECNVRFLLLENTTNNTIKNQGTTNILNIISNFSIGDPTVRDTEIYLGNLFKSYGMITPELQSNLYCQDFKIGDYRDPLLKLRNVYMERFQFGIGGTCFNDENDISDNYIGLNRKTVKHILKEQIKYGLYGRQAASAGDSAARIAENITDGLNSLERRWGSGETIFSRMLSQNPEMLYVTGHPSEYDRMAKEHQHFVAPNNNYNPDLPGDIKIYNRTVTPTIDSLNNNMDSKTPYTVIDISGLSVSEPMTGSSGELASGTTEAPYYFNKYITAVNKEDAYYMNLFWLQYYIFRIIIGTDNYLWVNAFRQIINNNNKIDVSSSPGSTISEPKAGSINPRNYMKNTDCTDSTTDYLLISLVESPADSGVTKPIILNSNTLSSDSAEPAPWRFRDERNNSIVQLNGNGLFLQKKPGDRPSNEFWILDTDSFNRKYADPNYQHLDPNNPRCADMIWRSSANPDAHLGAGINRIPCDQQRGYCTEKIGIASEGSGHQNKIISWIDGYDYNTGVLCYYDNKDAATTNVDNASCTGDSNQNRVSSFSHKHDLHKNSFTPSGARGQYPYRECILPNSLGTTTERAERAITEDLDEHG